MRNLKSGTIVFGMVQIPVGVGSTTTSTNEPTFRTLHEKCKHPVSKIDYCDECEGRAEETIKGYEYAKGEFVHFSPEEMEMMGSERGSVIEIRKFVPITEIKPVMIDSQYFLIPNEKAAHLADNYGIIYQTLADQKIAGVGTQTLWGKEHPCSVIASKDFEGGVLMMQTLKLYEDLVKPDFSAPIPNAKNRAEAKKIIAGYIGAFEPEADLMTGARARVKEMVAAKMAGREIEKPGAVPAVEATTDIMAALREMYEQRVTEKKKAAPRKKKEVKA